MFKPVNSRINFPQLEKEILDFWEDQKIFEKSVEARRGATQYTLYDGPPTANGNPGIHHVLSRVFKDIMPRYKCMKGFYAPRKAGWDTHGLPVELEIEKKLGFSGKAEIEQYGVAEFNALCRESVFKYLDGWNAITKRIGFWLDLDHPYITLDNNYIESGWWTIKQLWDKGLVYQGYKTTPHCPRCGTSLSSHEVALGYREDTEDPSVYIKFKLVQDSLRHTKLSDTVIRKLEKCFSEKNAYFLAWTTTPWTLPGNTALAIAPEAEYAVIEVNDEYLIMAVDLLASVGLGDARIEEIVKGDTLVNATYEPLFNPHKFGVERRRPRTDNHVNAGSIREEFEVQETVPDLTYHVIGADFVSLDDGTGIVHVAPAFGEVDFDAGKINGLDFVQPVSLEGKMTGTYPFSGKFVKDADPMVLEDLKARGLLFRSETIKHTYPFCWRCESPLLYYAKRTWYIRTTAKKEELIAGNARINWYPDHIKYGRFGDWLNNNIDWAFSRERYWGTPLCIWNCPECGHYECIGSVSELRDKPGISGLTESLDLHRPYVDNITFSCPGCGGTMKRQPEVIDCWFDSGNMPLAQFHYPFENNDVFEHSFPADYICEAVDQTRGWFYSLHALSTLLFGKNCFENVICLGHILDAEGEKMSKAKGNVVDPWKVLDEYGADAVRWYLFTSSPAGNVRRFSTDMVSEVVRNFMLTLWNTYSFFVMYANIDQFSPDNREVTTSSDLDKWALSRLNQLIIDVEDALEHYDPTTGGRKIEIFVNDLSNWYVRRSRRRFWKSQSDDDKMSAYYTLYRCLVVLSKLLAPFIPFVAEALYRNMVLSVDTDAAQSVHLTEFPVADRSLIDRKLDDATDLVMKVCSLGRAARAKAGVKVRQPLPKVLVRIKSETEQNYLVRLDNQILDELNVKSIEYIENAVEDGAPGIIAVTEGDLWVAVDTELSPELKAEGIAREVVRRLQTMRRSAGLDITDSIIVYYSDDNSLATVMEKFGDYIRQETLSRDLIAETPPVESYTEKHKLSGKEVIFGINKAAE